ncbi:hypothetical protein TanjilG_23128 [Lupinus angustifolius]|uniref:UBC core domain-containing protein n=1 Tax=Lupinus angustifolius TaxID=3871 RepID=A0A1J7FPK6_LUPAN|nr:hypothetical protein TanjilG_23128 [Lupinus angustifolius]
MSTPARKRLMRDFKRLQQDPPAGISGAPQDNNIMLWNAVIFGPDDTPWDGGTFKLTLQFSEDYPNKPPTVRFVSRMFHPNIYADGSICLDILQNQWSPIYDVAAILTSIQQQSYSSNPFLLSFPQLSSYSSLHPPGTTDPLGNSIFNLSNPTHPSSSAAYDSQTALSQNWIVQQSDPIGYGLICAVVLNSNASDMQAVGSSYETSAASNQTLSHQVYANYTTIMTPNQSNVTNAMKCEVCKIDCNSRDVYEKHISGKKHKRTLQVQSQISSIQGQVSTGAVGKEMESQNQKVSNGSATIDSVKICTACNIVCNSQEVLNKHLAGKKHCGQVSLMSNNGVGPYIAAFKRHSVGPWKKAPKKIKVAQSAWCAVCKINCNSRDVYIVHLSGRKHLKNLEKLSKPKIDAGAMAGNALQSAENSIIGPQEKPSIDKQKSPKASEMDIEAKKRKVVEGGASAAAVRLCTLCNVVCNSQTVFNTHLTGQKHAAAVKKQSQSTGSTTS